MVEEKFNSRLAVAMKPSDKKRVEALQRALSSKRGYEVPMTHIIREGLAALAKQEKVS